MNMNESFDEQIFSLADQIAMSNHYTNLTELITKGKNTAAQKRVFIPENYWDKLYIEYCKESISDLIDNFCKIADFEGHFPEVYGDNVDWDALEEKYEDVDIEYEVLKKFMLEHETEFIAFVEKNKNCDEHTKTFVTKILHDYFYM